MTFVLLQCHQPITVATLPLFSAHNSFLPTSLMPVTRSRKQALLASDSSDEEDNFETNHKVSSNDGASGLVPTCEKEIAVVH